MVSRNNFFYQSVIHIILPQVIECLKYVLLGNSVQRQHHHNINSNINIDVTITNNINIIINIKLLKDFMMSYLACSSSTCSLLGSVTLGTEIGEPES